MNTELESHDYDKLITEQEEEITKDEFQELALREIEETLIRIFKQANKDGLEIGDIREVLNNAYNVVNTDNMICIEEA